MTATGGAGVNHDARGNITAIGSGSYSYDIENRLTSGGTMSWIYTDPAGRLLRTVGAADTRYAWDGHDLVIETDSGGGRGILSLGARAAHILPRRRRGRRRPPH